MIKILDCKNNNYKSKLNLLLERRRSGKVVNTNIVPKIINDIKRKKNGALIKYEKKFSRNHEIKPSKKKIIETIKTLDPKVREAIDFSYNRILSYHSKQKIKNINYKDKFNNNLKYKFVPIESVGIYVPANLPSSLFIFSALSTSPVR